MKKADKHRKRFFWQKEDKKSITWLGGIKFVDLKRKGAYALRFLGNKILVC
jgi:hypothetical protein